MFIRVKLKGFKTEKKINSTFKIQQAAQCGWSMLNKRGRVAREKKKKAEDKGMSQSKGLKANVKAMGSPKGFEAGE